MYAGAATPVNPALRQAVQQRGLGIIRRFGIIKPVFAQQRGDFRCYRLLEPFLRVGDVRAGRGRNYAVADAELRA